MLWTAAGPAQGSDSRGRHSMRAQHMRCMGSCLPAWLSLALLAAALLPLSPLPG